MLFEMCAGYELPSFKPNSTHLSDVEIYPQVQILSFCSLFASAFFYFICSHALLLIISHIIAPFVFIGLLKILTVMLITLIMINTVDILSHCQ